MTIEAEEETFQIPQGHEKEQIVERDHIENTETEIMIGSQVKRIPEKGNKKRLFTLFTNK